MTIRKMIYLASKTGDVTTGTIDAFSDLWDHADMRGEFADNKFANMTIFEDWLIIEHIATNTVTFIDKIGDLITFEQVPGGHYWDIRFSRWVMHNGRIITEL